MSRRTRDAVLTTLPDVLPLFEGSDVAPPAPGVVDQISRLVTSTTFDAWTEALGRVGNCSHPIRLVGQLIRAGIIGGKTVPENVEDNPLVFATVTAPSIGVVHTRRDTGACHAGGRGTCEHGPRQVLPADARQG